MSEGIDDILNGVPEEGVAPEPEIIEQPPEENAEPPKAEQPRGPDGKFAPKGETDAPPASEGEFDGKATLAERRKRQEAEQRIADLEARIHELSNPPQPAPDMFEAPDAWQQHFSQQIGQQAVSQASLNATLNTSEMLCRDKFDDFEEMKASFLELAEQNPTIAQQALSDPHPWRKAYQIAKTHSTMQQVGATDVDTLKAQLRAEIEAELKAQQPQADIPQTLAAAPSGRATNIPAAPPTLQDLLK